MNRNIAILLAFSVFIFVSRVEGKGSASPSENQLESEKKPESTAGEAGKEDDSSQALKTEENSEGGNYDEGTKLDDAGVEKGAKEEEKKEEPPAKEDNPKEDGNPGEKGKADTGEMSSNGKKAQAKAGEKENEGTKNNPDSDDQGVKASKKTPDKLEEGTKKQPQEEPEKNGKEAKTDNKASKKPSDSSKTGKGKNKDEEQKGDDKTKQTKQQNWQKIDTGVSLDLFYGLKTKRQILTDFQKFVDSSANNGLGWAKEMKKNMPGKEFVEAIGKVYMYMGLDYKENMMLKKNYQGKPDIKSFAEVFDEAKKQGDEWVEIFEKSISKEFQEGVGDILQKWANQRFLQ